MAELSRLSDLNIDDDILRAELYHRISRYIANPSNSVLVHFVAIDETYRPDLVSYRLYGTPELRWLVSLVCDVDDEAAALPVGEEIRLPPAAWLRTEIRRYSDELRGI
ncbi:hypothetical protein [Thaumasiovibrio sp. DFM-14]|uniref:hypothetical protein n=1 Tax=Thaumasiovibrio sp. DFM-14 TaxID=3384792 RepID=UPI00399FD325